jgi:uncharacterized protein (TIGR02284 family)
MSNPSNELKATESAIQCVLDNLVDSQEALQQIGEKLQDDVVKRFLLAESLKRAEFRGDLETVLHQEGVHDIKESGTTAGTVHRVWAGLKAKLGGGDHTLLATAEACEDGVKDAYEKALDTFLPLPIRQLVRSQYAHIQLSHDYVRAARDHAAEAA